MLRKDFLKSVSYLAFSNGVHAVSYLLFYILLSRTLSSEEYGEFRQAFLFYEVFSPLFSLGFPVSIYYFLSRVEYENRHKTLIDLITIVTTSIIFLFSVLYGTIHYSDLGIIVPNLLLRKYFFILFSFCLSSALIVIITNYLIFIKKEKFTAIVSSSFLISMLVISFLLSFYKANAYQFALLRSIIYIVYLFILLIYTKSYLLNFIKIEKVIYYFKYSIPIFIAGYIGLLSQHTDKIIITKNFNTDVYAVYINGAFELPVIGLITGAISTAFLAEFTMLCKNKDMEKALQIFHDITKTTSIFIFPLFIYFLFNSYNFIVFLFGTNFKESSIPFTIYLFLLPIRVVFYGPALVAMGKQNTFMIRSFIELILNIIVSLILLQYFGAWGVAIGTVLSVYLWSVPFNLLYLSKGFGINFFYVLPFKYLGKLFFIVTIPSVLLFSSNYFIRSDFYFLRLSISALFYFSTVFILLKKFDFFKKYKYSGI